MAKRKTTTVAPAAPNRECYLRRTEIRLADGNVYSFRAIPYSPQNIALLEAMLGGGKSLGGVAALGHLRMLAEKVKQSMLHDQDEATVDDLIERGVVPIPPGDDEIGKLILGALMLGAGGS